MAHATAVILIVGLTDSLIGEWSPRLREFRDAGHVRPLRPVFPAVTCSVQASMLTGISPGEHGIVGNGWFDRTLNEVHFWKQSHRLITGEKVWETARHRDPAITTATMFWWFNMATTADFSVTPRPIYKADGRKIPDCHSHPADLRDRLQAELGMFPLFQFWGPGASIVSTRWIAQATQRVVQWHSPTLTLAYLPHLDYALQKFGPDDARAREAVREVDAVAGELIAFFQSRGTRIIVVSEYAIEAVSRPIHINRHLREAGLLRIRSEQGLEILDTAASEAFAVADHQIAHVHVRDASRIDAIQRVVAGVPGVDVVAGGRARAALGLDHARAGDIVLVAERGAWFTYYYWMHDSAAPDFARTVDIHRKPGYDPVELFLDPAIASPRFAIARRLLMRKLGFRTLMDVIPLDAALVRGSHGRVDSAGGAPLVITDRESPALGEAPTSCDLRDIILASLFD